MREVWKAEGGEYVMTKLTLTKTIPKRDLIDTNAGHPISMARLHFVGMLLEMEKQPGFSWGRGLRITVEQDDTTL